MVDQFPIEASVQAYPTKCTLSLVGIEIAQVVAVCSMRGVRNLLRKEGAGPELSTVVCLVQTHRVTFLNDLHRVLYLMLHVDIIWTKIRI